MSIFTDGNFSIQIGPTPITLSEESPFYSAYDLRLFNYRDTTPLPAGQVDDSPYGGGAGMVMRVDVVDSALQAAYGDTGSMLATRRVALLTPGGRQLDDSLAGVREFKGDRVIHWRSGHFRTLHDKRFTREAGGSPKVIYVNAHLVGAKAHKVVHRGELDEKRIEKGAGIRSYNK